VKESDHTAPPTEGRLDGGVGWFRAAALLLSFLLALQCAWLVMAELYRPTLRQLPTTAPAAAASATVELRDRAARAASIGAIRGELWAESAFSYANLLFDDAKQNGDASLAGMLATGSASLTHALSDAPAQSGAWLFRAGLALRYPVLGFNALEALKMSYYTGPTERELMPLRLRMTTKLDWFSDVEMRQFISRDLRLLLAQKRATAIAEAYDASSSAEKSFIEQAVGRIDPPVLRWLRSGAKRPSVPN
jgi:hypothetical protein